MVLIKIHYTIIIFKIDKLLEDLLVEPVDRIINIFKMIRELKGKYQSVWKKLSPNDDAEEEDFR